MKIWRSMLFLILFDSSVAKAMIQYTHCPVKTMLSYGELLDILNGYKNCCPTQVGVCTCQDGKARCCDGTISPVCICSNNFFAKYSHFPSGN